MRKETLQAIEDAIYEDDNACQVFGGNWKDQYPNMTEDQIVERLYKTTLDI